MAVDSIEQGFGGELAVGNADDAFFALQGTGNYQLVVFAAKEKAPPSQVFLDKVSRRRIRVVHVPLLDQYSLNDVEKFHLSVKVPAIAQAYRNGSRVLIACNKGINRSAFVAALVLDQVHEHGGAEAVRKVRSRRVRGTPLQNPFYIRVLEARTPKNAPRALVTL